MSHDSRDVFTFPKWVDDLGPLLAAVGLALPVLLIFLFWYGGSPATTDVGYAPIQPVPYSHALHAGQLGIDCRYCHNTVEVAAHAAIPPTQTCMNCHTNIRGTSPKLALVRESALTGMPVPWVRVHDLPDFVYFNHSAHVRRGVGCVECHGRIDTMDVVHQAKKLSMGWCLDCHRNPDARLRDPSLATQMDWAPPAGISRATYGRQIREKLRLNPSEDCSTCHR
jgi:menaquinone reductase, multiheme cytochrome c subunit